MSVTGNRLYILRALEQGVSILNLFSRRVHACDKKEDWERWERRYNRQLHKMNGMQEMAECFDYVVTFDFDESQGFYAEVTHINILYVDDDGVVLGSYRYDMRRAGK